MSDLTRVEQVFSAAESLPPEQRDAYLRRACGDDEALRQDVQSLLDNARLASNGFLDSSDIAADPEEVRAAIHASHDELTTDEAGRYVLGAVVGLGGSGVVYRAWQTQPLKREVAVKVLHAGVDRTRARVRFEMECAALALMDHPNIARIFDVGRTVRGQPFLVMEYIVGQPMTDYCRRARMDIPDRLRLFAQACDAIQHAHQKGVIHRDLKPSNIMVAEVDGRPCVKIIDFSIAKSTAGHQALAGMTRHGEVLGSLPYMAPEQLGCGGATESPPADHASHRHADNVDTRADVYALGAVLYELLTDSPPLRLDLSDAESIERLRAARKAMAIDRPSERVRMQAQRDRDAGGADDRANQARRLRGDLDWIVVRSLEYSRARRYETAAAFADDVRRHLRNLPVEAAAPSTAIRVRKFIARNRNWVVPVAFAATLMLVSLIGVTMQAYRLSLARRGELQKAYMAGIAGGDAAVTLRDSVSARRLLEATPAVLRNWEWHYLERQSDHSWWSATMPSNAYVMRLSRDGRFLAIGDSSGNVTLLDPIDHRTIAVLAGSSRPILTLAISPDCQLIASGDAGGTVLVWNVDVQRAVSTTDYQLGPIASVAFSSSGDALAVMIQGSEVIVREVLTSRVISRWHAAGAFAAAFINNDAMLAAAGDGGVRIWNAHDGSLLKTLEVGGPTSLRLASTADGSMFAADSDNGHVTVWSGPTFKQELSIIASGSITAIALSEDKATLGVGTRGGRVDCWQIDDGREIGPFLGATTPLSALTISPHATSVYAVDRNKTLYAWRADPEQGDVLWAERESKLPHVDVAADGRCAVVCDDSAVHWLKFENGRAVAVMDPIPAHSPCAAITPDGTTIVIGTMNDLQFHRTVPSLARYATQQAGPVSAVRISGDGRLAASTGGGEAKIWDVASGAMVGSIRDVPDHTRAMEFLPDGSLVVGGFDGVIRMWNKSSKTSEIVWNEPARVSALASPRNGSILAIGRDDGQVTLLDLKNRRAIGAISTGAAQVQAMTFSNDALRLFVGAETGVVQVWRTDVMDLLLCLRGHKHVISRLIMTDDGRLFSSSFDGTLRVWDGRPRPLTGVLQAEQASTQS